MILCRRMNTVKTTTAVSYGNINSINRFPVRTEILMETLLSPIIGRLRKARLILLWHKLPIYVHLGPGVIINGYLWLEYQLSCWQPHQAACRLLPLSFWYRRSIVSMRKTFPFLTSPAPLFSPRFTPFPSTHSLISLALFTHPHTHIFCTHSTKQSRMKIAAFYLMNLLYITQNKICCSPHCLMTILPPR